LLTEYLPHLATLAGVLEVLCVVIVIPAVLLTKRDATVAVAWCLLVLLVPLFGALFFWAFGYNYLHRRVGRKSAHRAAFRKSHPPALHEASRGEAMPGDDPTYQHLGSLALAVRAFPVIGGNAVTLYHETEHAFNDLLEAIRAARRHVHLEFFIVRSDATAERLLQLLTEKAKAGVEVRFLFDAMGSLYLKGRLLRPLLDAGGRACGFLPVNPFRSLIQVNLRNHRKIVVIDGAVGFTGGMNVGDEYLGKGHRFGYWRDTFLRLEGPAVAGLQRVFTEDWDFAGGEALNGAAYFPAAPAAGGDAVQVVESGPDQDANSIREVYFAAILAARERLWIASPYFVPDAGMLDALRLARYRGVDVRLLCIARPDHFLSFYASRYYWSDLLAAGAHVYQYTRGMMHSKIVLVDGRWAMVGSANLDNRSLRLNFEVGCALHTPERVAELEARFQADLKDAAELDAESFARRPFVAQLTENACRLFSPVL
jgi:cardiolipin synthase A/B